MKFEQQKEREERERAGNNCAKLTTSAVDWAIEAMTDRSALNKRNNNNKSLSLKRRARSTKTTAITMNATRPALTAFAYCSPWVAGEKIINNSEEAQLCTHTHIRTQTYEDFTHRHATGGDTICQFPEQQVPFDELKLTSHVLWLDVYGNLCWRVYFCATA